MFFKRKDKRVLEKLIMLIACFENKKCSLELLEKNYKNKEDLSNVIDKASDEALIAITSDDEYILTKLGEYKLKKMTKSFSSSFTIGTDGIVMTHCEYCGERCDVGFLDDNEILCHSCERRKKH